MPPGSTAGYKFEFLLREMVAQSGNFANQDFDHLPIPYRAMATNIENGTSKEFRRRPGEGDACQHVWFRRDCPVEIDGALYVDGGLLQNLPVAAARGTCADVVIVVDVGGGLLARTELNSALGISLQMINVLMAQNVRESIESLGPDDVLISPALGDFSAANFAESMTLVGTGEAAAHAKADQLRRFFRLAEDYQAWRASVTAACRRSTGNRRVASRPGKRVNPKVLEGELARQPGIDLRTPGKRLQS